jgi:hypothetical protein
VEKYLCENGITIRNYEAVLSDSELLSSGQLLGIMKNEEEFKSLEKESNNATDSEEKGLETVYNNFKERNCT